MYCRNCGLQIGNEDKYCRECGHQSTAGSESQRQSAAGYVDPRRLTRLTDGKKIAGVCAGLAQYFDVDVTLVRLLVVLGIFFSCGLVLLAYIIAWIIMPRDSQVPPFRPATSTGTQTAA
jgi:phage shock protein C